MLQQIDHAMLLSATKRGCGMDDSEADRTAILAVIRAETEAWLQRDFEALASHWVQSPQTRRMSAFTSLGVRVDEGRVVDRRDQLAQRVDRHGQAW